MPKILSGFGVPDNVANNEYTREAAIAIVSAGLLPLALQRDLSSLAHFSAFGIVAIIYVIVLIVF